MKGETIPPDKRLAGIEWMRGIAAFGVICIHSGLAVHNRTTPATGYLREGFGFVVPFFLMTSFFFAVRAEKKGWLPWSEWLKRHAGRLLLPFAFWSAVYLTLHVVKLLAHHQYDEMESLLADPAALVLSGGSSVALYFIPLLFTGLVLIHLLSGLFRQSPAYVLVLGLIASFGLDEVCYRNGFADETGSTGFGPAPFHLLVALIGEGVRCSPLIFVAGLLNRCLPTPTIRNAGALIGAGSALLGQRLQWRQQVSQQDRGTRRELYGAYLTALSETGEDLWKIGSGGLEVDSGEFQKSAYNVFQSGALYSLRAQIIITAPSPVVDASRDSLRALRHLRDCVAQGEMEGSQKFDAARRAVRDSDQKLRDAMRADLRQTF